jgi:hypothetical protein
MHSLSVKPSEIGISLLPESSTVMGLLVEFWTERATVSLVAMVDGSTSLYFSNGGGLLGHGSTATVATATAKLVALVEQLRPEMQLTSSFPTPADGRVRFFLMTSTGVLTREGDQASLLKGSDRFSPVFHQAQEVINEIRIASEFPPMVAGETPKLDKPQETSGTMGFLDLAFQGKTTPVVHNVDNVFPAIEESAREFIGCFGPTFTKTPSGHIETDIAGAASVAGSIVLRATGIDLRKYTPGAVVLSEIHDGQDAMLRFMAGAALGGGLGMPQRWNEPLPTAHKPRLKPAELIEKLQSPFEEVCQHSKVPVLFYGHIAGLTAIRLVQAGNQLRILKKELGIAIAFQHVVVGCRTIPLRGH